LYEVLVPRDQHQQQGCRHAYPFLRHSGWPVDSLVKEKLPYPASVVRDFGGRIGSHRVKDFQYLAAIVYLSPTSTPD
jgi:hypothetical protein